MVRFRIECQLPFSREDYWRLRSSRGFLDFVVQDGLLKKMEASPVETAHDGWNTRIQYYCPAHVDCPPMIRAIVGDTMFAVDDYQRWNDHLAPFRQDFTIRPSFLTSISKTSGVLLVETFRPRSSSDDHRERFGAEDDGHAMSKDSRNPVFKDDVLTSTAQYDRADVVENAREEHLSTTDASTDADDSENGESTDVSDMEGPNEPSDVHAVLSAIPSAEKLRHVVLGETRVSIPTLGWLIERAIVHNLRNFYNDYPATVTRFRQKLYRQFAGGDKSVPCSVVVDRFLENEAKCLDQSQEQGKSSSSLVGDEQIKAPTKYLECGNDSDNDLLCVE